MLRAARPAKLHGRSLRDTLMPDDNKVDDVFAEHQKLAEKKLKAVAIALVALFLVILYIMLNQ
jgi:hypothetical protein